VKNLLAIALGLGALGVGAWRLTHGEMTPGVVIALIGVFLILRGVTGTVRQGL